MRRGAEEAAQWAAFDQSHRRSPLPEHIAGGAPTLSVERIGPDDSADPVRVARLPSPQEPQPVEPPSPLRIVDTREPS